MSKITDAYSKFTTSLNNLLSSVDDRLLELQSQYDDEFLAVSESVAEYLDDQEITSVLSGSVLSGQLDDVVSGADTIINTCLQEVDLLISQGINNIQDDYQAGIELAVDAFNDDIAAITGWTEEMTTELEDVTANVSDFITTTHNTFSSKASIFMESISTSSSEKLKTVNAKVEEFINNRPILRLTGFVQLPNGLYIGESNNFRVGVANIGGADWFGWLGMKLDVVYYSDGEEYIDFTWNSNVRPSTTPRLPAGQTQVYPIDVHVPSDTESGNAVNIYLLINTV